MATNQTAGNLLKTWAKTDEIRILNISGGIDSTAEAVGLVLMNDAGDDTARPDLCLFADVGAELPETYAYIAMLSDWLVAQGFPAVTVVTYAGTTKMRASTPYKTILGNMIANETFPSALNGTGSCSIKAKQGPMDKFLFGNKNLPAMHWVEDFRAANSDRTGRVVKFIGYNADEANGAPRWNAKTGAPANRAAECRETQSRDGRYDLRYPLVEWGWDREECKRQIEAAGLPVPTKSACFFCPNQQPAELAAMATNSPKVFLQALAVEENARTGKHGLLAHEGFWRKTRKSDGRPGSWVQWATEQGHLQAAEKAAGMTLAQVLAELKANPDGDSAQHSAALDVTPKKVQRRTVTRVTQNSADSVATPLRDDTAAPSSTPKEQQSNPAEEAPMNTPMRDFVNRGGLGELLAAGQTALEYVRNMPKRVPDVRTIPLQGETAPAVGDGVNTTPWWLVTDRLDLALRDGEKARTLEANVAPECPACCSTSVSEQATCRSPDCGIRWAGKRLDGTPERDQRALEARVVMAELLAELRMDPGAVVDFGCLDVRLSADLGRKLTALAGRTS